METAKTNIEYLLNIGLNALLFDSKQLQALNEKTSSYLNYGVLRRYRYIKTNYNWILSNLPQNRINPLTMQEINDAELHLNSIYFHTCGILDNIAWTFLYHLRPNEIKKYEQNPISLQLFETFSDYFENIFKSKNEKQKWLGRISNRRHPFAHRLPLQIPAQKTCPKDQHIEKQLGIRMQSILNEVNEAPTLTKKRQLMENRRHLEQQKMQLPQCDLSFIYEPKAGKPLKTIPLYPTIETDLEILTRVIKQFNQVLLNSL
jgi:hypothetical protein